MTCDKKIKFDFKMTIPEYTVKRGKLFAPATYLIDTWKAEVEEIIMPTSTTSKGVIDVSYDGKIQLSKRIIRGKGVRKIIIDVMDRVLKPIVIDDSIIVDLRRNSPSNYAHVLNKHLPIALLLKKILNDKGLYNIVMILPKSLSKNIYEIYYLSGLEVIQTNRPVMGRICHYSIFPWSSMLGISQGTLEKGLVETHLINEIRKFEYKCAKKIFISRKDTRKLLNEKAVEMFLCEKGFIKVYLEDIPVIEQVALIVFANDIVAIHGAALGPLVFKQALNQSDFRLVELFSPGLVVNMFRVLVEQAGGKWVGVRGKLWPERVKYAYKIADPPILHSYHDFEVDLKSLELAMNTI